MNGIIYRYKNDEPINYLFNLKNKSDNSRVKQIMETKFKLRGPKMLSTFKEKLKDLERDSCESLKIAVKRKVGKRATALLESVLKELFY